MPAIHSVFIYLHIGQGLQGAWPVCWLAAAALILSCWASEQLILQLLPAVSVHLLGSLCTLGSSCCSCTSNWASVSLVPVLARLHPAWLTFLLSTYILTV